MFPPWPGVCLVPSAGPRVPHADRARASRGGAINGGTGSTDDEDVPDMKRFLRGILPPAAALLALALPPAGPVRAQSADSSGVPVTLAPVVRQDVPIVLSNIGTVQAFLSVQVHTRVDGTLERVLFQEGQDVTRGQQIAQIDPRPYQAVYDQAQAKKAADQAQLANAQRDLARYSQLAQRDFSSRQTLDTQQALVAQYQATLKGDDASIAAARVNLDYCAITAPFDGRIGLRSVDPGNVVRAADSTGMVTINQIHPIAVVFTIPQDRLLAVQQAMAGGKLPVKAFTSDNVTELGTGELATTDNTIDSTTGTIRLKAVFPNQENHLWPGQFVNAQLQIAVDKSVLTVPSIAVQRSQTGLYVYLAKPDHTVAVTPVAIGHDDGTTAIITKGLQEGASVVVNGMSRLSNGMHYAPTSDAGSGAKQPGAAG